MAEDNDVVVFPRRYVRITEGRFAGGRCPECGAEKQCYACASKGGWLSEEEALKQIFDPAG